MDWYHDGKFLCFGQFSDTPVLYCLLLISIDYFLKAKKELERIHKYWSSTSLFSSLFKIFIHFFQWIPSHRLSYHRNLSLFQYFAELSRFSWMQRTLSNPINRIGYFFQLRRISCLKITFFERIKREPIGTHMAFTVQLTFHCCLFQIDFNATQPDPDRIFLSKNPLFQSFLTFWIAL